MGTWELRIPRAYLYVLAYSLHVAMVELQSYGASCDLIRLAIVVLVVRRVAVAVHSHNVGEHGTRTVVLVRIDKDTETLELIGVAKDRSRLCTLLGEPHGKAVAVKVTLTMDLEFDNNLLA